MKHKVTLTIILHNSVPRTGNYRTPFSPRLHLILNHQLRICFTYIQQRLEPTNTNTLYSIQHRAQIHICTYNTSLSLYMEFACVYFSLLKPKAISPALSIVYLPGLPIHQQRALLFPWQQAGTDFSLRRSATRNLDFLLRSQFSNLRGSSVQEQLVALRMYSRGEAQGIVSHRRPTSHIPHPHYSSKIYVHIQHTHISIRYDTIYIPYIQIGMHLL